MAVAYLRSDTLTRFRTPLCWTQLSSATATAKPVPLVREVLQNINGIMGGWGQGWVEGELGDRCQPAQTGHYYLTLRDPSGSAALSVVLWATKAAPFRHLLKPGARIQVRGQLKVYAKTGALQLDALEVLPVGIGALLARIQHTKELLVEEGLTHGSRKRDLDAVPVAVGLIAAPGSAAFADFTEVARRRWPSVVIKHHAVTVQGARAVEDVTIALANLDADPQVSVIVIARGGGSPEDLLPFSDEGLCRAIAATGTAVVAAVGHETDTPLIELVADLRAATPTDAACLVTPDVHTVQSRLDALAAARFSASQSASTVSRSKLQQSHTARHRLAERGLSDRRARVTLARSGMAATPRSLAAAQTRLNTYAAARERIQRQAVAQRRGSLGDLRAVRARLHPENELSRRRSRLRARMVALAALPSRALADRRAHLAGLVHARPAIGTALIHKRMSLDSVRQNQTQAVATRLAAARARAESHARQTENLPPLAVLERGYALVTLATGKLLRDPKEVVSGDLVSIRVARGVVQAAAISPTPERSSA